MRRSTSSRGRLRLTVTTISVALLVGSAASAASGSASANPGAVSVLRSRAAFASAPTSARSANLSGLLTNQVIVRYRGHMPSRVTRTALDRSVGARLVSSIPTFGMDIVRARPGRAAATVAAYERDPSVAFAEISVKRPFQLTPNDTQYANGNLWALNNTGQAHVASSGSNVSGTSDADIDASEAWDTQTGSATTVIAVIDTGVQLDHPDLVNNLWTNSGEIPANGIDDDGNGYIDDVHGYDFGDLDGNPTQTNATCDNTGCPAHGTHVAGIIGAEMNNGQGVAGVCPGCEIMPIKVTTGTSSNFTTTARLIQAYAYVDDNGADIVNGSYGGPIFSKAERDALKSAGDDGVLFSFAAANSALDNDASACRGSLATCTPAYPASYNLPTIVSVAATNDMDRYGYASNCPGALPTCAFSNWGRDSVDVAAPGVDIISTRPGSAYFTIDGTSMASPEVAGTLGLIKSEHPSYTPVQLKNALMNSVDHPSALKLFANVGVTVPAGGIAGNFTETQGRINADAALSGATTNATPATDGTPQTAKGLSKSKNGTLGWPADVNDYYKKQLRKGTKYKVTLTVPNGANFDVYLWKPGVTETWSLTTGCYGLGGDACPIANASTKTGAGADEAFTYKPSKSGLYYLNVTSFFSGGKYTVKIVKA